MVLANWQLVLAGEVALVQWAECLKKFQAHSEVLHRLRLVCASWPVANHSASSLPPWFSSPFCFSGVCSCTLPFLCGDLERSLTRLCGSTVAQYLQWPSGHRTKMAIVVSLATSAVFGFCQKKNEEHASLMTKHCCFRCLLCWFSKIIEKNSVFLNLGLLVFLFEALRTKNPIFGTSPAKLALHVPLSSPTTSFATSSLAIFQEWTDGKSVDNTQVQRKRAPASHTHTPPPTHHRHHNRHSSHTNFFKPGVKTPGLQIFVLQKNTVNTKWFCKNWFVLGCFLRIFPAHAGRHTFFKVCVCCVYVHHTTTHHNAPQPTTTHHNPTTTHHTTPRTDSHFFL